MTSAQLPMVERLDSLFTNMQLDNEFNGVVLVARNDTILLEKAYGFSSFSTQEPLKLESVFDLASVSKQFTAMGIVQLQKQGKLNYEDTAVKYIPELKNYPEVTIHQLLTHTSGLPDYMSFMDELWDKSKYATNADVLLLLEQQNIEAEFEPGTAYNYSNTGYLALASIIEKASNMSFGEYLDQTIFKPLGLKNTTVHRSRYAPKKINHLTTGHVTKPEDGSIIAVDEMGMDFFMIYLDGIVGDGMVNTTINDLYLWTESLSTNKIINDEDREDIFTNYTTTTGENINYGYGFQVNEKPLYGKHIAHSGGWAGYSTYMEKHLDKDLTFLFLQNVSLVSTRMPVGSIRKILYNQPLEQMATTEYSESNLEALVGEFKNAEIGMNITTFIQDMVLMAQATGQGAFPLSGYKDYNFKFKPADITITFSEDRSELYLKQGPYTTTFKK